MMAAIGATPDLLEPKDRKALDELGYLVLPPEIEFFRSRGVELPVVRDLIDQMIAEEGWRGGIEGKEKSLNPENPWLGFGSVDLCWALGDRIEDESSLLHWIAKNRIPVVIPGITDGSIGAQIFMHRQKSPDFMIDVLADQQILSDLTWTAEESHALMVGGGISKHHVIWWNQYRGGLDSAVSITTAPEYDGSLSGARLREAISWGKIRPEASQVVVEGDASVLLPLLGGDLFSQ